VMFTLPPLASDDARFPDGAFGPVQVTEARPEGPELAAVSVSVWAEPYQPLLLGELLGADRVIVGVELSTLISSPVFGDEPYSHVKSEFEPSPEAYCAGFCAATLT
jgi:hypothetical protein